LISAPEPLEPYRMASHPKMKTISLLSMSTLSTHTHHPYHPKDPLPHLRNRNPTLSPGLTRSIRGDFLYVHMLTGAPPTSATCRGYSSHRGSVKFSRLICITLISLSVILRWAHPTMIAAP
ncbi:hypothetical protein P692DRAFT_20832591, partial [Suillus brevipes Sb2]